MSWFRSSCAAAVLVCCILCNLRQTLATLPVCPDSPADFNGHYVYTVNSPPIYMTTADSPNIATQSWSASMWVKPTIQTVAGFNPILGQGGAGGCGGSGAACTNNLMIAYRYDGSANYDLVFVAGFDQSVNPQVLQDYVYTTSNVNSDIGQWQFYVFEYNIAGIFSVWRNGLPLTLSALGQLTSAYTGAAGVIALGAAGGTLSNYFVGSLDEIRIWYGVNIPVVDVAALWCNNVVNSVPSFYMNGGDFLSFGTAQTTSSPAPALSGADVTNECYGFCPPTNSTACSSSPCTNGGVCIASQSGTNFACSCVAGYSGSLCQTNINECGTSPCLHGGVCIDAVGTFSCNCAGTGYSGIRCATAVSSPSSTGGNGQSSSGSNSASSSSAISGSSTASVASSTGPGSSTGVPSSGSSVGSAPLLVGLLACAVAIASAMA